MDYSGAMYGGSGQKKGMVNVAWLPLTLGVISLIAWYFYWEKQCEASERDPLLPNPECNKLWWKKWWAALSTVLWFSVSIYLFTQTQKTNKYL